MVREYRNVYQRNPDVNILSEFFWLFNNYEYEEMPVSWKKQMNNIGNCEVSIRKLKDKSKMFSSFDDFLNSID